jgi:hypothetical protein
MESGSRTPAPEVAEEVGESPDVVFVPVGEDDALHVVLPVDQPPPIGEHQVDAEHVLLGEHQPAVDEGHPILHLDRCAVAPDLTEPTEERDPDRHRVNLAVRAGRVSPTELTHGRADGDQGLL